MSGLPAIKYDTEARPVCIFYRPPAQEMQFQTAFPGQKLAGMAEFGALYWCTPGQRICSLDSRLPLLAITEISTGKQTARLLSAMAKQADEQRCFSLFSAEIPGSLDFQAETASARNLLLSFIDSILSHPTAAMINRLERASEAMSLPTPPAIFKLSSSSADRPPSGHTPLSGRATLHSQDPNSLCDHRNSASISPRLANNRSHSSPQAQSPQDHPTATPKRLAEHKSAPAASPTDTSSPSNAPQILTRHHSLPCSANDSCLKALQSPQTPSSTENNSSRRPSPQSILLGRPPQRPPPPRPTDLTNSRALQPSLSSVNASRQPNSMPVSSQGSTSPSLSLHTSSNTRTVLQLFPASPGDASATNVSPKMGRSASSPTSVRLSPVIPETAVMSKPLLSPMPLSTTSQPSATTLQSPPIRVADATSHAPTVPEDSEKSEIFAIPHTPTTSNRDASLALGHQHNGCQSPNQPTAPVSSASISTSPTGSQSNAPFALTNQPEPLTPPKQSHQLAATKHHSPAEQENFDMLCAGSTFTMYKSDSTTTKTSMHKVSSNQSMEAHRCLIPRPLWIDFCFFLIKSQTRLCFRSSFSTRTKRSSSSGLRSGAKIITIKGPCP